MLAKINQKDLINTQREFYDQYLAIAYFRVPQFRQKLLESIIKPTDPELSVRG